MKESIFTVGMPVAVENGDGPFTKMFVAARHKNGNFLLAYRPNVRPEPQQWRDWGDGLHATGNYSRTTARPWTADVEAEQRSRIARWTKRRRARQLRELLEKPDAVDDAFFAELSNFIAVRVLAGYGTFPKQ